MNGTQRVSGMQSTSANGAILSLQGLHKSFGRNEVLHGLDLQVQEGEVVALIGASGSGKSTLLRCINRLETPTAGTVQFRGNPITADNVNTIRREIGMVFQRFHLFPHLTALQNVTIAPCKVLGVSPAQAEQEARALLDRVKLSTRANSYPDELSGGQQQRVAIARALALNPALLLFDEPTSALDPELVGEVLDVMRGLACEGRTMLVATHEMAFARDAASRVVFLDGGVICEQGTAQQVLESPCEERTRAFLSRILNR